MNRTRMNIYLSETAAQRLKAYCHKRKLSYGEVVEHLLHRFFSTASSPKGESALSQHQEATRKRAHTAMQKVYSDDEEALIAIAVASSDKNNTSTDEAINLSMPVPKLSVEMPMPQPTPQEVPYEYANALHKKPR